MDTHIVPAVPVHKRDIDNVYLTPTEINMLPARGAEKLVKGYITFDEPTFVERREDERQHFIAYVYEGIATEDRQKNRERIFRYKMTIVHNLDNGQWLLGPTSAWITSTTLEEDVDRKNMSSMDALRFGAELRTHFPRVLLDRVFADAKKRDQEEQKTKTPIERDDLIWAPSESEFAKIISQLPFDKGRFSRKFKEFSEWVAARGIDPDYFRRRRTGIDAGYVWKIDGDIISFRKV
jgi:hypothetical protein